MTKELTESGGPRCQSVNPKTGNQCIMGHDHFGPHVLGGPYRHQQTERWVTKCSDEPCVFHENSEDMGRGQPRREWEECIHCGDTRPLTERAYIVEYLPPEKKRARKPKNIFADILKGMGLLR